MLMGCRSQSQNEKFRVERDTFGELQVPASRYWGAQTQRYVVATSIVSD